MTNFKKVLILSVDGMALRASFMNRVDNFGDEEGGWVCKDAKSNSETIDMMVTAIEARQ